MPRSPAVIALVAIVAVLSVLLVGCSGGAAFDPTRPCTPDGAGDGVAPGTYPELEQAIPSHFRGEPPKNLDSGRTCSTEGLSTLGEHGITEVRFAGGTWQTGPDSGVSLAVFTSATGPALQATWMEEFYEAGARTGRNVQSVEPSDYAIGSIAGKRVDVLNGESYQTVIAWPRDGRVAVVLIGSFIRDIQTREAHEGVVKQAVAGFDNGR